MRLKKNPKIDVGRNSTIYFLIGLNIMLLFAWKAIEYKTYDKGLVEEEIVDIEQELEEDIPIININTPPPPPPPPPVVLAAPEEIIVVDDKVDVVETLIESSETSQEEYVEERVVDIVKAEDVEVVEEIEEETEVPFAIVESVPVFPGCTGTNEQLKKCFNDKVLEHIKKTFKYPSNAQDLGVQGRVYVMFIVDANGNVVNIKTRGPDKSLEKEANRIISELPKMTPGRQRDRAVSVPYSIPIMFKLQD